MITKALLNPLDNNVVIVLNACLKFLSCILEDPTNTENLRKLFGNACDVSGTRFLWNYLYPWVMVSLENPGAKIGFGVGVLLALVVAQVLDFPVWKTALLCLVCSFTVAFIGSGVYDWNEDPLFLEQRQQQISLEQLRFIAYSNSWFSAPADDSGNLSLTIEQKK